MQVMFSGPLPGLSNRLNAWATALTCQWLMGPCQVNDVEHADGKVRRIVLQLSILVAWDFCDGISGSVMIAR